MDPAQLAIRAVSEQPVVAPGLCDGLLKDPLPEGNVIPTNDGLIVRSYHIIPRSRSSSSSGGGGDPRGSSEEAPGWHLRVLLGEGDQQWSSGLVDLGEVSWTDVARR